MNGVSKNAKEMVIQAMEYLEKIGYDKHSIWANVYTESMAIVRYINQCGHTDYNLTLAEEFVQKCYQRYENKEVSREYYTKFQRTARKLAEFYESGIISITVATRGSKYILCDEFERLRIGFLESRIFHPNTREDFSWAVRRYLVYFQDHGICSLKDATIEDARLFIIEVSTTMKAGSLHNLFCYIKQFHVYLKAAGEDAPDCIELFSVPVKREYCIKGFITDKELDLVLDQMDSKSKHCKRDKAIIMLAATTGLRAIDIVKLKLSDIDWRKGEVRVCQKKTGIPIVLPLLKSVGEALKDYILTEREKSEAEEVFLRTVIPYSGLSDGQSVQFHFTKYLKKAGIERQPFDGRNFHGLRRRLGRSLLVSGSTLSIVSQVLGHQDMETAKYYISLDSENLKECALSFSGIEVERRGLA